MDRDAVRRQLELTRLQRVAASHREADLAQEERRLEAMLGHELEGDTPGELELLGHEAAARVERNYGTFTLAEELPGVIHAWRARIPGASALYPHVDATRDHVRGDPSASVVVVEYGDYQCTECAESNDLLHRITPSLEDGSVCFVFRHFPLVDAHPLALHLAQASEAAAAQDRFWEMHERLMAHKFVTDNDEQTYLVIDTPIGDHALERVAHGAGLDLERFRAELDDPVALTHILDDFRSGLASGVNGTPTFFVNGERADLSDMDDLYAQITRLVAG